MSGQSLTGFQCHVLQCRRIGFVLRFRNAGRDWNAHRRIRSVGDHRFERRNVYSDRLVEVSAFIAGQLFPSGERVIPVLPLWSEFAAGQILKCAVVGCDQTGARPRLDGHVADGHARVHIESANRGAGEFENASGSTTCSDLTDQRKDHVLCRHARLELSIKLNEEIFGFALQKALGREDHLDFARTDPVSKRAERAVRGGMTVAADDGRAGLAQSQLRTDYVNDSLFRAVQIKQRYPEFGAIRGQGADLIGGHLVETGKRPARGRNRMIHGCKCLIGAADFQTALPEAGEGLRRRDLVDQMQVDIENGGRVGLSNDDVGVPDFVV